MKYWESGVVLTALLLGALLVIAAWLRRSIPALRARGIPDSIVAGLLGLLLGPEVAGALPLDGPTMESLVYHGLAVVFIAVGLQPAPAGASRGARSMAFAIPLLALLQGAVGLLLTLGMGVALGEMLHPGFGLMLPLGFSQGPGQALSFGAAWEATGLAHGAQVGLIVAALGYVWAIVVGVPLVNWGRRRGLTTLSAGGSGGDDDDTSAPLPPPPGGMDALSRQVVAVAVCYLVTYGLASGVSALLRGKPQLQATVWGLHFLIGIGVALGCKRVLARFAAKEAPLHAGLLGRVAGTTVDAITCAAIAAVQISVLSDNLLPILLITTVGGTATLLAVLWMARRGFPDEPFHHAVILFGTATGTLPTGLALLRMIDPQMRSSASRSVVLGSPGAFVLTAPLVVGLLPWAINQWPHGYPGAGVIAVGVFVAYMAALLAGWHKLGGLQPATAVAPAKP